MKHIAILLAVLMLLAALAGCAPKGPAGFEEEPMDAAVFDVLNPETQAFFQNFANDPPVSMMVRYDQYYPDATVTDAALMRQMYDAIAKIRISAKTNVCYTDAYHCVTFTTADGKSYGLSFENKVLCENDQRYVLDNTQDFWKLFKSTAEDRYEQPQ